MRRVAQIEHVSLELFARDLVRQFSDCLFQCWHRPFVHQRDTEVTNVAALLPAAHALNRHHFAHKRELNWLGLAFAQKGQSDPAADGTYQLIEDELIERDPLYRDTIDVRDDVVDFESRLCRGALVERRDDLDASLLCDEFHAGPNEMRYGNLHVAEERPGNIARLGIEHADHAFNCRIDKLRLIELVDIAGLHALQGSD